MRCSFGKLLIIGIRSVHCSVSVGIEGGQKLTHEGLDEIPYFVNVENNDFGVKDFLDGDPLLVEGNESNELTTWSIEYIAASNLR